MLHDFKHVATSITKHFFLELLVRTRLFYAVNDNLSRKGIPEPVTAPSKYSPDLNRTGWLIRRLLGWQLSFISRSTVH
jgi:hypothetical protein